MEIAGTIAAAPPLAVRAWRQNLLDMSMPLVTKSLHDELSAQMLIYKSDDFAEFKKARAEDRAPVYRTT
jgi:enoyl-CoA hydratase